MTALSPFDLLPRLDPRLQDLDAIPLTGRAPPFPWEQLSNRLSEIFHRPDFSIVPKEIQWRAKENLYEGLGDALISTSVSIPELKENVFFVISKQGRDELIKWLLFNDSAPHQPVDEEIIAPFYRFFMLESLYQITQTAEETALHALLNEETSIFKEDALCWDIHLVLEKTVIYGRLAIPPSFRKSWVNYFTNYPSSSFESKATNTIHTTLIVSAGSTTVTLPEWSSINEGDCLLIDQSSIDPSTFRGNVKLYHQGEQIFEGLFQKNEIKILKLPLFQEVNTMPNQPHDDDEDETSEFDLSEDEEEFEPLQGDDDDFFDDEEDDELIDEDEAEESIEEETSLLDTESEKPIENEIESENKIDEEESIATTNEIPLKITVELARIEMPLDSLQQLEPGNLLPLNKKVTESVNLSINGRVVAKGELIRLGELLGVRIQEVGK